MNNSTSKSTSNLYFISKKSDAAQSDKSDKQKILQLSLDSNGSSVRLGDYVRKRKWSKQKLIIGQVKSSQLVGQSNQLQKQLEFKRENINRFYNKIIEQIEKRKRQILQMTEALLFKEQKLAQQIFNTMVGRKQLNIEKINLLQQTSTISTKIPNVSNKYTNNSFLDNGSFLKSYQDKLCYKNLSSKNLLEDSLLKQFKDPSKVTLQQNSSKLKHNSFDLDSLRKNTSEINQITKNTEKFILPTYQSRTPKATTSKKF